MVRTAGMVATGGKVTPAMISNPQGLFSLPQDSVYEKVKDKVVTRDLSTVDKFAKFHAIAKRTLEKEGVDLKPIDFEKLKESHN